MHIEEVESLPEYALQKIKDKGIGELNPPQAQAVKEGLMEGESQIISSPTASGKTLIATMAISKVLGENSNKKALYLVPLKALASEKYNDYKDFFGDTDIDVAISLGDRDSSDSWLESKNLIILTVEKLDSLLRHNPSWIKDVELVVEDEIHLLNDPSRGPTLEVTLTRLRELMEFQLLGLSATISNSKEMADWLDCKLIKSDYRPVELKKGIFWQGKVEFYNSKPENKSESNNSEFKTGKEKLEEENAKQDVEKVTMKNQHERGSMRILENTLEKGKQAITFVRSRKSAEKESERLAKVTKNHLNTNEKSELENIADQIKSALSSPTKQCKRLAKCVRKGSAFHHAGLVSRQRSLIEENFRKGLIKSISATPTLAMGLSLPAYRIILRDLKRYTSSGLNWIPTLEYQQMAGRAGRPEYDPKGEAISIAKSRNAKDEIVDRYIFGEAENIYSKLAVEPVLRMHTLSLVATGFTRDRRELLDFFSNTFYAHQYQDTEDLENKIIDVLKKLQDYEFLDTDGEKLKPTRLGKRVAELYIDPYSAHHLLESLKKSQEQKTKAISFLHMLCECVEMKPRFRVKKNERDEIENLLAQAEEYLISEIPEEWDFEYDTFLNTMKTAFVLYGWINEVGEDKLMDKYGVTPGGIRAKLERADWLVYSSQEMCQLKDLKDVNKKMEKLRLRLKHGIKEELLPLVKFKGIGRVRARKLYEKGIEKRKDIVDAPYEKISKIIGKKTAEKLKKQVGEENVFDRENIMSYFDN